MISNHPALLLTRPNDAAQDFARKLDLGPEEEVVISPLIEIEFLQKNLEYQAAIFSSHNGVIAAGAGHGRLAYCVGDRTAEFARKAGFDVKETCETASALVKVLVSNPPELDLIHLHGEFTRGDVANTLKAAGLTCDDQVVYLQKTVPMTHQARSLLEGTRTVVAPVFSPRTAELFADQVQNLDLPLDRAKQIHIIALSQNVADQLPALFKENIFVPQQPTRDMMLQIVARYFRD